MTGCSKFGLDCRFDFRISLDNMRTVIRRAEMYDERKGTALYGIPTYPFLWTSESMLKRIRFRMGQDEAGRELVALFRFDQAPMQPGVGVHVSVYVVEDPDVPDWSGTPLTLVNYHLVAVNHFRGCLQGVPIISPVLVPTPPAPETNPPPPPPPDSNDESTYHLENK